MTATDLAATRRALHLVATHVLARRRHDVTGRIGLRASPGGFATPAFGPDPEVVRVGGAHLIREVGGTASAVELPGATLRGLAAFAATDLDGAFSAGDDTPPVGDPDAPLPVAPDAVAALASWWALGWSVLDAVTAGLGPGAEVATIQLWPEHFDAATTVTVRSGSRVNLGFSPGDTFLAEPYAYVGPWGPERPGAPEYWNAPFGAVLTADRGGGIQAGAAPWEAFVRTGLGYLAGA